MNNSIWRFIEQTHKWIAIALTLPVIFVFLTGIILQIRKPVDYIQPNLHYGVARYQPTTSLNSILESIKAEPKMKVKGWQDVMIMDLRPKAGVIKIRTADEMEAQVDVKTAKVLNVQQRWNDIITLLHDGSTWGMRTSVFLIAGLLTVLLGFTGAFLIYQTARNKISASLRRSRNTGNMSAANTTELRAKPSGRWKLMRFCRKYHFYLSIFIIFPWLVASVSGVLLQVRYEVPWVMPERQQGVSKIPTLEFTEILETAKKLKGLKLNSWDEVWRIYIYPNDGIVSVRTKDLWEAQFDSNTGELLDLSVRRTDLLEDIHEGKWLKANWWFFLPAHIVAIIAWFFGVYLWVESFWPRRRTANKA